VLVHGVNVRDGGRGTTDRLIPFLEAAGLDVLQYDYGWTFVLGARLWNGRRARRVRELAAHSADGAVGVGHSNGCAVLWEACRRGAEFGSLVFINPALDRRAAIPPQVHQVDVFWTEDDVPTRISRFLPWNIWGDMGARGYRGQDARGVNWDMKHGIRQRTFEPGREVAGFRAAYAVEGRKRAHSRVFDAEAPGFEFWMATIAAAAGNPWRAATLAAHSADPQPQGGLKAGRA